MPDKNWRYKNPERWREICQKSYHKNKEHYKKNQIEWRKKNRESQKIKIQIWRNNNRERVRELSRQSYLRNREKIRARQNEQYRLNPEKTLKRTREYQQKNADKIRASKVAYYHLNREKILETTRKYNRKNRLRRNTYHRLWDKDHRDLANAAFKRKLAKPSFHLAYAVRVQISIKLRKYLHNEKKPSAPDLLGCNFPRLKRHLESQFTEGMSWDNYGKFGWHIDHIIPCAWFDLRKKSERFKCFNYHNLRPLWSKENWQKGNRLPSNHSSHLALLNRVTS